MAENSKNNAQSLLSIVSTTPSLLYQEDAVSRAPHNVTAWIHYLDAIDEVISEETSKRNKNAQPADNNNNNNNDSITTLVGVRDLVARRALQHLPKSYKLWKMHWEFCSVHEQQLLLQSTKTFSLVPLWERALVTLHKYPRVWIEYLEYAHGEKSNAMDPTQLRHLANRALEAIPVTQHDKIWPTLLKYYQSTIDTTSSTVNSNTNSWIIPKETKLSLLRRYIMFNPAATKEVADFFASEEQGLHQWGEAALLYVKLLNQPHVVQRDELWMALANICTRHPVEQVGIDWEALVRGVIKTKHYKEMEGVLWSQLADAWIRRGEFQLARSVYEEALESVSTVRDFTILLDAYLQFEEGLLEAIMATTTEEEDDKEEGDTVTADKDDWDLLLPNIQEEAMDAATKKSSMSDLELALARAEDLTARRPILLNRVLLRQNPHDVGEWIKRARLYKENGEVAQAQAALEEGLRTVHARHAVNGSPSHMVTELVALYESDPADGVAKARDLMDRICNQWVYEFKHADDLAECHATWVELELRQEAWDAALDIIRSSVVVPTSTRERPVPKMVRGLPHSLRLWDLVLDLEESLGTVQTTKDAYSRAIEQRIATPLHILNYATFLTENKYFEESFSAYERGIELFEYPGVKVIWKAYLDAFLKRYGGTKIERTRDLFHRCIEACPADECAEFFLMNGTFEEEHGLTKRALSVYHDMCNKVPAEEKYTAYQLCIAKTTKYMGQTATRDIYQSAIQSLVDAPASKLCLDFAKMETSLQEIDRARAILIYGAQTADPRRNEDYWKQWNEFEIAHGNEETFREMLRIKRSVEASFSTVNYNAAEMSQASSQGNTLSNEEAMRMIAEREGVELDPQATASATTVSGFVSAKRSAGSSQLDDVEERVAKLRKATTVEASAEKDDSAADADENEDEIDIDDMDEENEEDEAIRDVTTKVVPAAVFGGLEETVN